MWELLLWEKQNTSFWGPEQSFLHVYDVATVGLYGTRLLGFYYLHYEIRLAVPEAGISAARPLLFFFAYKIFTQCILYVL